VNLATDFPITGIDRARPPDDPQGPFLTEDNEGNKDRFRSDLIAGSLRWLRFLLFPALSLSVISA
jgi:hypothetical protein